jgi:iron complex transport system substrate-binding protein
MPSREQPKHDPMKEPSFTNTQQRMSVEKLSAIVVDCAYKLHVEAGPGLLETVYEVVLARMLSDRGLKVERQVPVPIELMGLKFDEGFRADLIVEDSFLIELKSVEHLAPVHSKQVLTYLRLLDLPLGLLINFGAATFKEGVKRIVNNHQDVCASLLRVNQPTDEDSREGAKLQNENEQAEDLLSESKILRDFAASRETPQSLCGTEAKNTSREGAKPGSDDEI